MKTFEAHWNNRNSIDGSLWQIKSRSALSHAGGGLFHLAHAPTAIFVFLFLLNQGFAQNRDSIYFKNFVYHANGTQCTHTPPNSSFMAFLNRDESSVLLETSPRWNPLGDPNIAGNGMFGVELGNFTNPGVQVGDSAFARFTCAATQQQGVIGDSVTGIPWWRIPLTLTLSTVTLPTPPQNVSLTVDTVTYYRTVSWSTNAGETYIVYRRISGDTIVGGRNRMLYTRVGMNIPGGSFTDTTTLPSVRYGYIVFAVSAQGVMSAHSSEVNEDPVFAFGDDLTISYIARLPRLNYVWGSPDPDIDGWPIIGQEVLWQAIVKNWTASNLQAVPYKWFLGGVMVDSGTVSIPAGDTASVNYPWIWTFVRHVLTFVIDPPNIIPEEEEQNNQLTIYTNAISVGLYVEQSVYDYFREYQRELPNVHSNCWEDWAQRQVQRWNQMFVNAVYPETPLGVLDRIRLDKITIVPDSVLPLAGGLPTNHPNLNDSTVDLQWGFPATLLNGSFYSNHTSVSDGNPFYYEGSLIHELGHARYLIDVYGFNVEGDTGTVAIQENGQYVAGSQYMPYVGGTSVYNTPIMGLMNGQYTYVDSYSAVALNRIAGHRATYGNYNAPGNIGVFMQDLSLENRLAVKDVAGNILPGSDVRVYRATGRSGIWYGKYFDNTPDIQLTADSSGQVLLGRCPFAATGIIEHTYGLSNAVTIIRVAHIGMVGYAFLESSSFNFEYWHGNTTLGNHEIRVSLISPSSVELISDAVPNAYVLNQNYPNPFNPTTSIRYSIPRTGWVALKVFDVLGREVITLVQEEQMPGMYEVQWDGTNENGLLVPSGVYFYRLQSNTFNETKKLMLLR